MKWLNGYKMKLVLVGIVVVVVISAGHANADFTFGEPVALEATINSASNSWFDCISNDGLELYLDRPIGGGTMSMDWDLFVSTRVTIHDPWSAPVRLGAPINTGDIDGIVCLSSDDLELYLTTNRTGGYGRYDLWVSTRPTRFDSWGPPENLGPTINTSASELSPWITPDGLELYFASGRPGGYGNHDIWVVKRSTIEDNWGAPVNLGPAINSAAFDSLPGLSPGGLVLFFSDYPDQSLLVRPGGLGQTDMWMSRRQSITDPWEPPVNLGPGLNTSARDVQPRLSPDGDVLYFSSMRSGGPSGGFNIWQVSIEPIIDLNNDLKVDLTDMLILVDHWGENYSLCDIGPMPWGDGIVDIEDLKVLVDYFIPKPVAHWKLNEVEGNFAYDNTGNYDGELNGNPVWQPVGGVHDGALELNGKDNYISIPFILNPGQQSFSVFAWIHGGAPGQVIISQSNTLGARGSIPGCTWLGINPSNGSLITGLMDTTFRPLESDSIITDGQWHHIGLVYDYVLMKRYLYVDGVEIAADTDFISGVQTTGGLYIGAGQALDEGTFFSGLIDDVQIYDAVLTAEEIAGLVQ